ncbi:hypothetical protein BpHYR1_002396 [Brachionus plicatilis]|uniref:Uncharacterized protein n=1 Tax=Brachionus plicatilis TaxID=10195 RepID=A0A3M7RAB4_BRAPC|nr:hypothetical protein BpHYR1_002396 [Brachionus plicatilis]
MRKIGKKIEYIEPTKVLGWTVRGRPEQFGIVFDLPFSTVKKLKRTKKCYKAFQQYQNTFNKFVQTRYLKIYRTDYLGMQSIFLAKDLNGHKSNNPCTRYY